MKSGDGTLRYTPTYHYGPISIAAVATALFAGLGSRFLATLSLGCLSYFAYHHVKTSEAPCHDFTPTFNALDELVSSNATWETTVQDALQILEKEESHLLRTSAPSSTPTNALRVSVHTTLQTTRTQCDNVRQLFSALTCPTELAQLSEMYAPPSPIKSPLSLVETSPRPYSFPSRNMNLATPQNKRSTWHASYASLASMGSPPPSGLRKREKYRSGVSTLFQPEPATPSTASASGPVTPSPLSPLPVYSLGQIAEDINAKGKEEDVFADEDSFGPAALGFQRKRQVDGVGALSPPPSRDFRTPRTRRLSTATMASSSRFTSAQTPRHPLSLFTLQQSLSAAVSSKRYACSHLLALRFNEDEEEYWENVRSMMELLTTTFTDEAARLAEALEDVERQHLRDQNPTPDISREFEDLRKDGSESDPREKRNSWSPLGLSALAHRPVGSTSFAPMPSHLSRFAAHVASIMSSLEDAREHLRDCVDSLKEDSQQSSPSGSTHRRSRTSSNANEEGVEPEHRAILAYERLRRELGLALRECERGKQKLVDIVHPPLTPSSDEGSDGVPGFGHDPSDDSDKLDPVSPSEDDDDAALRHRPATVLLNGDVLPQEDDVTSHLLRESSIQALLGPPGVDQVYEADTGAVGIYTRERSKVTREERIRMMKARREAAAAGTSSTSGSGEGLGLFDGSASKSGGKRETWGPGGEVVQELKDVIWKVGEKRRKMQEQFQAQAHTRSPMQSSRAVEVPGVFDQVDGELNLPPLPESPSPASPMVLAYERAGVLLETS